MSPLYRQRDQGAGDERTGPRCPRQEVVGKDLSVEKPACSGGYPVGLGRVSPWAHRQVTVTLTQRLINGIA